MPRYPTSLSVDTSYPIQVPFITDYELRKVRDTYEATRPGWVALAATPEDLMEEVEIDLRRRKVEYSAFRRILS